MNQVEEQVDEVVDAIEAAVVVDVADLEAAIKAEFVLSENHKEYLNVLWNKVQTFNASVQAKQNDLINGFKEAVMFVKKELGVPADANVQFSEDGSKLVVITEPVATATTVPTVQEAAPIVVTPVVTNAEVTAA